MAANHYTSTQSMVATSNMTPAENVTVQRDVTQDSCFGHFETVACVRSSLLTLLAVITAVLCIMRIIRLHTVHHQNWHQYFIFYCASFESVICGVHWILSLYVQLDFVLQWLKLVQFLVMCHFYWTLATRALRREIWTKRFLIPFLAVAMTYFTVIAVLGIVKIEPSFVECLASYWVELSAAEFIIVQLFCVAGFYITRRLNEISTLDSVRRSQKRDLWCIVVVFEVSAFVGVLYDMSIRIIGDRETGCSHIFNHSQEIYSPIFFTFMVMKLLLPIWVMLLVFTPTPPAMMEADDLVPALSDDGTSAFSSTIDEQYRQLYHPTEDYRSFVSESSSSSPTSPPSTTVSTVSTTKVPNPVSLGTIREENNHAGSGSRQVTPSNPGVQQVNQDSHGNGSHTLPAVQTQVTTTEVSSSPRGKFYI